MVNTVYYIFCMKNMEIRQSNQCRPRSDLRKLVWFYPVGVPVSLIIYPHLFYIIMKTCLFKYTENFTTKKNENIQTKNSDIFHISTQNIDCGYMLELPQ